MSLADMSIYQTGYSDLPILEGSTLHVDPLKVVIDRGICMLADALIAMEQARAALALAPNRDEMLDGIRERLAKSLDDHRHRMSMAGQPRIDVLSHKE